METLFLVLVWTGMLIGLMASGYFLCSWGWHAWRKRMRLEEPTAEQRITGWQVTDYLSVYVLVFLTFALNMPVIVMGDLQLPKSWMEFVGRIMLLAVLDFVAIVRAGRWYTAKQRAESGSHLELLR